MKSYSSELSTNVLVIQINTCAHVEVRKRRVNWGGSNALFMAAFRPFDRPQVAQFSSDINATTLRPTFEVKQI